MRPLKCWASLLTCSPVACAHYRIARDDTVSTAPDTTAPEAGEQVTRGQERVPPESPATCGAP